MNALKVLLVISTSQCIVNSADNEVTRIVRGHDCKDDEYPAAGALLYAKRFICTGSVLSPNIFLTAAHCVVGGNGPAPAKYFSCVLGNVNRSSSITYTFSEVISHEHYDPSTVANDIAILRFSTSVDFRNPHIKPICIPKNRNFEGETAMAVGWGRNEKGEVPEILQKVEVDVTAYTYCKTVYKIVGLTQIDITDKQVCAGSRMKGVCNGDSGGPLVVKTGDKNVTIGVTSFGSFLGCAFPFVPAVYTSTSKYHDWIMKKSGDTSICTV